MIKGLLGIIFKLIAFILIFISGSIIFAFASLLFVVWCIKKLFGIPGHSCRCHHCGDIIDM